MNPRLYLTADGLVAPSNGWPCRLWTTTGPSEAVTLAQAARTLLGRSVDLLLPMELCSWVRTDPWPSRRHPGAQAIGFAVEDQLSEGLEDVHLGIGARDAQGRYAVLVIGRERLEQVLALMAQSGIAVGAVHVDADVLPGDQPVAVRYGGRWLLGGGLAARLALSDDELRQLAGMLPADLQEDGADIELLQMPVPAQAIDLRTGAFARRRVLMPWRTAGVSLLALALLAWGSTESRVRFVQAQTDELMTRNEQQFKALYPDLRRVGDLGLQLKALQGRDGEPQQTHMARLVSLMDRVVGASNVQVQRIEFRAGEGWKVQLTANSFAELEQLRERGRQQGMPVQLESASQQNNRVQVTLAAGEEI